VATDFISRQVFAHGSWKIMALRIAWVRNCHFGLQRWIVAIQIV